MRAWVCVMALLLVCLYVVCVLLAVGVAGRG